MAYFTLEPFGDEWLRTATVASIIANANRNAKVRPQPFRVEDFMPHVESPSPLAPLPEGEGKWRETKKRFMALVKK